MTKNLPKIAFILNLIGLVLAIINHDTLFICLTVIGGIMAGWVILNQRPTL